MSTELGPLYHWSPRDRLKAITRHGLMPGKRNVAGPVYSDPEDRRSEEFLQRAVCFSPSPARAWNYSHGAWKSRGTFDLWQVELSDSDEVYILPMWGARVVEVRVGNRIPKSRLVWVGERTVRA